VIELATQNKNVNFIGLDITYKRVVKAAKKLKQESTQNAKIAICDGSLFLEKFVENNSLEGVCVFFPDPWPKDRHEKNRLLNQEFVTLLKNKLNNSGFFWFKTDAQSYFENTEKLLFAAGFKRDDESPDNYLNKPRVISGGPFETAFQKLFTEKNVPFYQGVYIKDDKRV
jgi:tRNA (guanine-N7-)-methyltransferase